LFRFRKPLAKKLLDGSVPMQKARERILISAKVKRTSGGLHFHDDAQVAKPLDEAPGHLVLVPMGKMLGAKVVIFDSVAEHVMVLGGSEPNWRADIYCTTSWTDAPRTFWKDGTIRPRWTPKSNH
jgi:hypothetical protein